MCLRLALRGKHFDLYNDPNHLCSTRTLDIQNCFVVNLLREPIFGCLQLI